MMTKSTLDAILPAKGTGRRRKLLLSKNCYSENNATSLYQYLKLSLLDVNNWKRHKSGISINSKLIDSHGRPVSRIAQNTDRIKIILPRWKSIFKIYDWFEIQKIEEQLSGNTEIFYVTIVPSVDPDTDLSCNPGHSNEQSSLTIFIIRDQNKVQIQIHTHGKTLTLKGETVKDKVESLVNALIFQNHFYKRQWAKLLKSLLDDGTSKFTNLN